MAISIPIVERNVLCGERVTFRGVNKQHFGNVLGDSGVYVKEVRGVQLN